MLLFLLFALLMAQPASAQSLWNAFSPCGGELPAHVFQDVCSSTYLRRIERTFGVRPLAQVAGDKRAVRVVVVEGRQYVDGVGQFTILIDAIERADRDVRLIVHVVPEFEHTPRA